MGKLLKALAFVFIGMLIIASCTSEFADVTSQTKSRGMDKTPSKEVFNFKYRGIQYAAEYEIVDSTMVFTDPKIADIVCNLETDPYVATLTYPNGMVEYFDSNRDLEKNIEEGEIFYESINSRVGLPLLVSLTLKVYEDADFKGEALTFDGPINIPDLTNVYNQTGPIIPYSFNDKISSFQLIGGTMFLPLPYGIKAFYKAVVTFYEDSNYAYGSASFLIDRANPQISHSNFKKVKRCPSCKYNMNDRTSSIRLYWLE